MTKLFFGMVASVMLIGCDVFVTPKVLCDQTTIRSHVTRIANVAGPAGRCVFFESFFTVNHTPRVDPLQSPIQTDVSLVGAKVFVAQATPAVLLCAGLGAAQPGGDPCVTGEASITAVVGRFGQVSYRGVIEGVVLQPEGNYVNTGLLATENYGPGNSCDVRVDLDFECKAPPEPK